jgi:hypothetical protein
MDVKSKELLKDRLDAKNSELNSKTNFSQKGKTFYFEKENYVEWDKTTDCADA